MTTLPAGRSVEKSRTVTTQPSTGTPAADRAAFHTPAANATEHCVASAIATPTGIPCTRTAYPNAPRRPARKPAPNRPIANPMACGSGAA